MRRLAVIAALLSAAACATGPCQELGERICACTGQSSDTCTTQAQEQLKAQPPDRAAEAQCIDLLASCGAPPGATFCEWLLTPDGKRSCGLAP